MTRNRGQGGHRGGLGAYGWRPSRVRHPRGKRLLGCSQTGKEKNVANAGLGHAGGFVGRNGLGSNRSFEIADDLKDFRLVERIEGEV
jgi:hypothetical protein